MPTGKHPLNVWRANHPELTSTEVGVRVNKLWRSYYAGNDAYKIGQQWDAYSSGHTWSQHYSNHKSTPDLVRYVSIYGYAQLLIQGWTELPIDVPTGQEDAWREWNIGTTIDEFYQLNIASIAGGFFRRATADLRFTVDTIKSQLNDKSDRMVELAHKPVEWFTLEEYTQSELDDLNYWDNERVDEIFELLDNLHSFMYGLPKLRDIAMTEHNEEFELPNMDLYFALEEVDLNRLHGQLKETEAKLRPILQFVTDQEAGKKHPLYTPINGEAPDSFWWRHWKPEAKRARHRSHKN